MVTTTPTPAKKSIKLPIILMVWPAAGIILSIALYAIFNFILGSIEPANASDITAPVSPLRAGLNILLFLVGAASAGLGPISFIVGLVLLVSRKK